MPTPPQTMKRAAAIVAEGLPIGPRMFPCVCGTGRHAHAGSNATGANKDTGCKRYRANLAWTLAYDAVDAAAATLGQSLRAADKVLGAKRRAANPVLPGQWRIGVSDLDTCPKAIQYRNLPPEGFVPAWEDKREALMGQMIHDGVEERMRMIYPWRQFEQTVKVPGLDRESRYDWYDPITLTLGDYKTAGDWRWDRLGENGPDEETWDKVQVYAKSLNAAGIPVKTVRLDYIKRCNGHDEPFERPYDEAAADAALDRLLGYATSLDLGIDLPKTGTGPSNDPLCRRCFARNDCWNIEPAQRAGRSPESYTVLGEDPETDDIIWAISEKVDAAAEQSAAKRRVDETKSLLDGIEPGRYGPFEGYLRKAPNSGGPDHKADAEHLRQVLDLPDGMRPSADQVPVPVRSESHYIAWGRVRKATLDREKRERAALADAEATEKGVA